MMVHGLDLVFRAMNWPGFATVFMCYVTFCVILVLSQNAVPSKSCTKCENPVSAA